MGTFDSGLAIWGNKAYLEEAGVRIPTSIDDAWTMEEFTDALQKLNALDQVDYAIDFKLNYGPDDEWNTYGFAPIIQSFGGDLIDRTDYQSADGVLMDLNLLQRWNGSRVCSLTAMLIPARPGTMISMAARLLRSRGWAIGCMDRTLRVWVTMLS